jgi:hypothetical protein
MANQNGSTAIKSIDAGGAERVFHARAGMSQMPVRPVFDCAPQPQAIFDCKHQKRDVFDQREQRGIADLILRHRLERDRD